MNKEKAMLKIQKMSIEEKVAMLSETDEAYIRGFIEGTIFWIYQKAQQNSNGIGRTATASKAKPKSQKTGHLVKQKTHKKAQP